jgi:hypothetical protein
MLLGLRAALFSFTDTFGASTYPTTHLVLKLKLALFCHSYMYYHRNWIPDAIPPSWMSVVHANTRLSLNRRSLFVALSAFHVPSVCLPGSSISRRSGYLSIRQDTAAFVSSFTRDPYVAADLLTCGEQTWHAFLCICIHYS